MWVLIIMILPDLVWWSLLIDTPHPQDCMNQEKTKVVPSDVERWVRQGLELGWNPKENGPQLLTEVYEGALTKYPA